MKKSNATTAVDVDHYLANGPEPARATLQKVRATIRSALPAMLVKGIDYS